MMTGETTTLLFLLLLLLLGLAYPDGASTSSSSCSADGTCSAEGAPPANRYSAEASTADSGRWAHLLSAVTAARAAYRPCNRSACGCISARLDADLAPWRAKGWEREALRRLTRDGRGVLYQVIGGRLYRGSECRFPARCEGAEHFLLRVLPHLGDLEFVLNDSDYPQAPRHPGAEDSADPPILSFSKVPEEHRDVLYPAWSFWAGGPAVTPLFPQGLGRWDQLRTRLDAAARQEWPWTAKESRGFFRGSRTSAERDPLVLLSRRRPALLDAAYTKNQAWRSSQDTLHAEPAPEVPLEGHCRFKFLLNARGTAASFRLRHLFLCRSTVLHIGRRWIEFFYEDLRPWVHYVPVSDEGGSPARVEADLEEVLEFAQSHDALMREIAEAGADFVWRHLRMEDVECYWQRLLRRYARLLRYKVTLDPNMRLIG